MAGSSSSSKSNKTEAEGKTTTSRSNGDEYCLVVGDFLEQLECPICNEVFRIPVFICENGHSICEKCKHRMSRCGYCEGSYLRARNFCIENILNNCSCPCQFQERGCPEIIKLANYTDHINSCVCNPDTARQTTAKSRKSPPISGRTPHPTSNSDPLFEQLTNNYEQYSRAFQSLLMSQQQQQRRVNAPLAGNMAFNAGSQGEQSTTTSTHSTTLNDWASTSGTTSSTVRRSGTADIQLQYLARAAQNRQNVNAGTRQVLRNTEDTNVPHRRIITPVSFNMSNSTCAPTSVRPSLSYPSSSWTDYSVNNIRPFSSTVFTAVPFTNTHFVLASPSLTHSTSSNQINTTNIPSSVSSPSTSFQQLNTSGSTFRLSSSTVNAGRVPVISPGTNQSRHATAIPNYNWPSLPSTTDQLSSPLFLSTSDIVSHSTIPQPSFPQQLPVVSEKFPASLSRNQSTANSSLNNANTEQSSSDVASVSCGLPLSFGQYFEMYRSHDNNHLDSIASSSNINNFLSPTTPTTTTLDPGTNLYSNASSNLRSQLSVPSSTTPEIRRRRKPTTGVALNCPPFMVKTFPVLAAPTLSIFNLTGSPSTIESPQGHATTTTMPKAAAQCNNMTSGVAMGTLDGEHVSRTDLTLPVFSIIGDVSQESSSDESPLITPVRTTSQNDGSEVESQFELYRCSHCTFDNLTSNETCTICSTPLR